MVCLLFATSLCSCNEKPLSINSEEITKIALTGSSNNSVVIDKKEEVTSLLLAVQNGSCVTSSTKKEELPASAYRFTTYNNDTPVNTMILYGNEYLQVDTALYKGNLADLAVILDGYAKVSHTGDLSPVFTAKTEDIIEIAFYNVTDDSFKIVTVKEDIDEILSPLQALKISDKEASGEISEQFILYVRLKDTNEYLPGIEINKHETGTVCSVSGKNAQVSNYNWSVLYDKLAYNKMPIKK